MTSQVVSGQRMEPARWKQCADSTNQFMGLAFGAMFIQQKFNKDSKATVRKLPEILLFYIIPMMYDSINNSTNLKVLGKSVGG